MIFNELRPWHLVILVVVFLALFGYKKLPDATRSVGRSLRIFKSEMKGMHDDAPEPQAEKPRSEPHGALEGQADAAVKNTDESEKPAQSSSTGAASAPAAGSTTPPSGS